MPTITLAGDTMLGRLVADRLRDEPDAVLLAPEVVEALQAADLTLLNLECCISDRGQRWPDPDKPFFFRAPPHAAGLLARWGVDAVTLANNHALDYGEVALGDTLALLEQEGVAHVGAGLTADEARNPLVVDVAGVRVGIVALADHPAEYDAARGAPGIAYADLARGLPGWLHTALGSLHADLALVAPHWGPNMVPRPLGHVRRAAVALQQAVPAATPVVIAGHSAHVPHGVAAGARGPVLYDLGDFVDDYAVHEKLRNDLGFLWTLQVDAGRPSALSALPLRLDLAHTLAATGADRAWLAGRLATACRELGTTVTDDGALLWVDVS